MSFWKRLMGTSPAADGSAPQPAKSGPGAPLLAVLGADMHSHVLPGLDDGADSVEAGVALVRELVALGYRKLIATPHIMGDFYRNTPVGVRAALAALTEATTAQGIDVTLECAAEYYLDEWFLPRLAAPDGILSFGGDQRYVLVETSYINESRVLTQAIFELCAAGYRPVIAHPERYKYLHSRLDDAAGWRDKGALLQINLNSLAGYYGPGERHAVEQLIDRGLVDFAGTDAHGLKHTTVLANLYATPYFDKLLALPLRNKTLLGG
ncbi:MAG: capsular biosynthesis protein [Hymenobacteraceae bacterium]|nr:capsular biosynthesis protein [Hymenobacteraceae bacterium]